MRSKLKDYIIKYTWLFPLIIMLLCVLYYMNLFERLYNIGYSKINSPIFEELQISIGLLLLITTTLNWALVGYAKSINQKSLKAKLKRKK